MNAKNIVKVKRPTKPQTQPPSNDSAIEEAVEALQQAKIEKAQLPSEPIVSREVFLGTPRDESMFGCGWSLTELLNEFSGRYDG
jgi:hypothetical protein